MKKTILFSVLVAFIAFPALSQTVNICGRVTDPSGKPLTHTLVRLGQTRFTDAYGNEPYYIVTDKNGLYHLGTGTCNVNTVVPAGSLRADAFANPQYVGGKVLFSLPEGSSPVKMSLYDIKGRFVKEVVDKILSKGNYSLSVDARGISSKFYALQITVNGTAADMLIQPALRNVSAMAHGAPEFEARLEKL